MSESPVGEPAVRAAKNQSLFREINERLRELSDGGQASELVTWSCECAQLACIEQIEMSLAEYESLRSNTVRFAVVADDRHVLPEVEAVVEQNARFWVVEKLGDAGDTAAALAPPHV